MLFIITNIYGTNGIYKIRVWIVLIKYDINYKEIDDLDMTAVTIMHIFEGTHYCDIIVRELINIM